MPLQHDTQVKVERQGSFQYNTYHEPLQVCFPSSYISNMLEARLVPKPLPSWESLLKQSHPSNANTNAALMHQNISTPSPLQSPPFPPPAVDVLVFDVSLLVPYSSIVQRDTNRAPVMPIVLSYDTLTTQLPQSRIMIATSRNQIRTIRTKRAIPDPALVSMQRCLEWKGRRVAFCC